MTIAGVSLLNWAFGESEELTPEFAKGVLKGPTIDEITQRVIDCVNDPMTMIDDENLEDKNPDNED